MSYWDIERLGDVAEREGGTVPLTSVTRSCSCGLSNREEIVDWDPHCPKHGATDFAGPTNQYRYVSWSERVHRVIGWLPDGREITACRLSPAPTDMRAWWETYDHTHPFFCGNCARRGWTQ